MSLEKINENGKEKNKNKNKNKKSIPKYKILIIYWNLNTARNMPQKDLDLTMVCGYTYG
jgi:hypothetical protein